MFVLEPFLCKGIILEIFHCSGIWFCSYMRFISCSIGCARKSTPSFNTFIGILSQPKQGLCLRSNIILRTNSSVKKLWLTHSTILVPLLTCELIWFSSTTFSTFVLKKFANASAWWTGVANVSVPFLISLPCWGPSRNSLPYQETYLSDAVAAALFWKVTKFL